MSTLVFAIALSAILSTTSLLVVLFRVSPLTSPGMALTFFFIALFLAVSSVGALVFLALWRLVPLHSWDAGKLIGISVRQGVFLALAVSVLFALQILSVLTWWIGILVLAVLVLVEVALNA